MGVDPWGFDEGRQALARRLRDRRLKASALRTSVFLFYFAFLLLGGSVSLRAWTASLGGPGWAQVALFLAILFASANLLGLPFAYLVGYRWEVREGLTERTLGSWLRDYGKASALGLLAVLVAGEAVLWLLAAQPVWWWALAWALGIAVSATVAFLAPVLLVPMFYRHRPLRDPGLRARFEALAASAGIPVVGVFELEASAKTHRSNAGVVGIGRTRRILVTDTLLRDYTAEEIDAVLAHEIGHQRFRDPWIGFAISGGSSLLLLGLAAWAYAESFPFFGYYALHDPAGLPLLALYSALFAIAWSPVELWWSRRREARADRFALRLTRNPVPFASAMVKLHDRNLGVAHPRTWDVWLFHSHPPGRARVEIARADASAV